MYRIDDATAATSLPVPEAAGTEGYFTEGNPATGTPATDVRGSWLNMIQEELRAIVVAGGLTPSKTTYNQALLAIKRLVQSQVVLTDTGAANAYAAANNPPLVAGTWVNGIVQQIVVAHTNSGPSTYAPDGLPAIPIYGLGLQPLQGNEMFAGGTAILMKQTIPGVNSGNPICVLLECAGGAQQVPAATASGHALQAGQALGLYLGTRIIDSSQTVNPGTYTVAGRSVTASLWRVRGAGSAGAGAGAAATGSSTVSVGTGGQGGSECEFWMAATSTSVTVGAAGAPGAAGANGGAGGTSSFGSLATLPGGVGGIVAGPAVPPFVQPTLSATGVPTGSATFVKAKAGSLLGTTASATSIAAFLSGSGGPSDLGTGGNATNGGTGVVGSGKGAGGSGAANPASSAATVGGAGLSARWIVDEFE